MRLPKKKLQKKRTQLSYINAIKTLNGLFFTYFTNCLDVMDAKSSDDEGATKNALESSDEEVANNKSTSKKSKRQDLTLRI